uniref:Putative secreted protein n=1 Tax=Ixodes scapularis TaxID=6945 RepID=A0A4D5RXQ6_IXOSC
MTFACPLLGMYVWNLNFAGRAKCSRPYGRTLYMRVCAIPCITIDLRKTASSVYKYFFLMNEYECIVGYIL